MGLICFFNSAIAWGGGEKWHFEVSAYLHSKGHPVIVFAHSKSVLWQKLQEAGIPSVPVTINNLSFINPIKRQKIYTELKKVAPETIVLNLSRDLKIAGSCAKAAGVKRIIYRRGSAIPIKNSFLNRHYFKNVLTDVLANSQATKKTVLEKNPNLFPEDKIRVIYNGIRIPESDETAVPPSTFTLVNLGRLEAQKNQLFLVRLAKELKVRQIPAKIIIGGEGRLRSELEQEIKKLGVSDSVELEGFIEEPLEFMAKGTLFVLPSLWEGFGYVLAEAALQKKAIIAFDLSSNPELVLQNKTGILVEPNNIHAFADAVEKLYNDPALSKKMGQAGYQHVLTHFDKKENIKKIESYLVNG